MVPSFLTTTMLRDADVNLYSTLNEKGAGMKLSFFKTAIYGLLVILCVWASSCQKPKEAKVVVTEQEFSINRVSEWGFEITAKGKVKNIGEIDVKNVVVTGKCPFCQESIIFDTWYVSNIEKTADEQTVIHYLPVNEEADFSFVGIAMYMSKTKEPPNVMPENLEIKIMSFEPAQ